MNKKIKNVKIEVAKVEDVKVEDAKIEEIILEANINKIFLPRWIKSNALDYIQQKQREYDKLYCLCSDNIKEYLRAKSKEREFEKKILKDTAFEDYSEGNNESAEIYSRLTAEEKDLVERIMAIKEEIKKARQSNDLTNPKTKILIKYFIKGQVRVDRLLFIMGDEIDKKIKIKITLKGNKIEVIKRI